MNVEKLFIELAKAGAKEFTPFPFNTILVFLIEDITKQEDMFSHFEKKFERHIRNVEKQLTTPFKEGKVYLEEAGFASVQEEREKYIRTAREKFITVSQISLPQYPLLPMMACFYVGVCYDLLTDNANALRWYKKSHTLAVNTITTQDPRTWHIDESMRVFSDEVQKKLSQMNAQQAAFDYAVMFAIPVKTDANSKALKFTKEYRRQVINGLENWKEWPMGEQATKQMFSFTDRLTELIKTRILHA